MRKFNRVLERPTEDLWGEDEPVTLAEGAALFTRGLVSERGLRTAIKQGRLQYAEVNGRFFTSKAAVKAMFRPMTKPPSPCPTASRTQKTDLDTEILARDLEERIAADRRSRSRGRPPVSTNHAV